MEAMRLQPEQQLTCDCMTGVGTCDCLDVDSPSFEALMTLLWAIHVFEKNRDRGPDLDVAMNGIQADGLGLFKQRASGEKGYVGAGYTGEKCLEGWRPVFEHDGP